MKIIDAQDWIRLAAPSPLLDVRSPGEFQEGHWPGANSLPLFDNEERAEVGTLYKQESPDAAFLRGLELAGRKMRWYVEEAARLAPDGKVTVHCWRGGQRSQSIAWLLDKRFAEVTVIAGGYKALRQAGRRYIEDFERPLLVLGGATGSGKTKVLQALQAMGESVVDLEGLAHHKGSAFGALGEAEQPTVEQFENDLFHTFLHLDHTAAPAPVWLEDESKSIGRVYLPNELWNKMRAAPLVVLDLPLEWRIDNLVSAYADFAISDLRASFDRIYKRLGGKRLNTALAALDERDFAAAAKIALDYYDKAYQRSMNKQERNHLFTLRPTANQPEVIADELFAWWSDYRSTHS